MKRSVPLFQSIRNAMRRLVQTICAMLLIGLAGCGTGLTGNVDVQPPPADVPDGNHDDSQTSSSGKTPSEPNDTFAQAIDVVFNDEGLAELQGTVSVMGDLDVFRLGPMTAGDRVILDASTSGSALDVSVALFDEIGRLVYANDDRGGSSDRFLDSHIDWIVRHDSSTNYLAVTNAAFADFSRTKGSYYIDLEINAGADVPAPVLQLLVLDFEGGTIDSPVLGRLVIAPFDAGAIAPAYRGQTEPLKTAIRATIEQNFERFGVTVLTNDDPPPAQGVEFSTVYLGGFNPEAFGIAEAVDLYNVDFCDDAVIFTESFTPSLFSRLPSVEGLGVAIGNVTAHEAGHLLGLNHVDDDLALMDDRSDADAFLEDQEFKEAPLSSDIMPIGTQDAVLLLTETVGTSSGTH